jgi:hypothetical protein
MSANTESMPIKRRIVYVDDKVQKGLLLALIVLEVALIAGTLWMMYQQMGEIVNANLYRVHFVEQPNIYPLLLKTILVGVLGLLIINVMVLWLASWMWTRHVDSILTPFRKVVDRVATLDFAGQEYPAAPHKVVELAQEWHSAKREQLLKIREEIARLDALGDFSDPDAKAKARKSLETIRELLPGW